MNSKLWMRFLLVLFLSAIVACGQSEDQKTAEETELFSGSFRVATIQFKKIPLYYEVVGTIQAKASTILSSNISGHIIQIHVEEGDHASEGETLVVIDDRDVNTKIDQAKAAYKSAQKALDEIENAINQARAKKQQAEANLSLAQTTFNRYERLSKEGAISDQEFDTVSARLKVSKAQVNEASEGIAQVTSKKAQVIASIEQAKSVLDETNVLKSYTQIKAPFDGVVIKKHVEVGSLAAPGVPVLSLENPKGFRLEVDVREKEFADQVKIGREAAVKIDALGNKVIYGKVVEIVPTANPMSRTFKVKIALPDLPGIKSGMYGKAMCSRGERDGFMIPQSALIRRGQLEQVFTVDDKNMTLLRLVKSGKKFENEIEILAGLQNGDRIILNPKAGLKDRTKVKVEAE